MNARGIKLGVASAVAGGALLVGGLVFGGTLVSAQTPAPTPQTQQQTAPSTPDNGTTPNNQTPPKGQHDPANCPNMDGSGGQSGSQSGSMYRGSGQGAGNGASFHVHGGPGGFRS